MIIMLLLCETINKHVTYNLTAFIFQKTCRIHRSIHNSHTMVVSQAMEVSRGTQPLSSRGTVVRCSQRPWCSLNQGAAVKKGSRRMSGSGRQGCADAVKTAAAVSRNEFQLPIKYFNWIMHLICNEQTWWLNILLGINELDFTLKINPLKLFKFEDFQLRKPEPGWRLVEGYSTVE